MADNKLFSRRIFFLGIIKLIVFLVITIRLFYMQIKNSSYFQTLSDKNRISLAPVIPKRGIIYDRFFTQIANNILTWELLFIRSQLNQQLDTFLQLISNIVILSPEEKAKITQNFKKVAPYTPILIKQNLAQNEVAKLETLSYKLDGILIRRIYKRNYPYNKVFSHIIGYVGLPTDLSKTKNINTWPVGKIGIELALDNTLKGNIGYLKYEVNAFGQVIRELEKQDPISGYDVSLTLDAKLQDNIFTLMQGLSGSCVLIDITTGDVLSILSTPSYNPNLFTDSITSKDWNNLRNDKQSPFSNKAAMGLYPPASVIKPIIALLGLEKEYITPKTTVECKGFLYVGNHRFHCWRKKGHGILNAEEAIYNSCDIFFYELAKKLKIVEMNEIAHNFGFGEKHLPLINYESSGKLLDMSDEGKLGHLIISSIGQGKWLTTPIQLAQMMAIIGNNNKVPQLNLLRNIEYKNKILYPKNNRKIVQLDYKEEYLQIIKSGLYKAVNRRYSTAYRAHIADKNWEISAKTGTAQVRRVTLEERQAGRDISSIPWQLRDHALFAGYFPSNNPQYAISLVLEHAASSSFVAAPLAKAIVLEVQKRHTMYQKQQKLLQEILQNEGKL